MSQKGGYIWSQRESFKSHEFVAEKDINYPILLGGDSVAMFMRELGNKIGALPFTAVVDDQGQIIATHQGEWLEKGIVRGGHQGKMLS